MKKSTLKILAILVLILAAFAVYTMDNARRINTSATEKDKPVIKIGVLLPLTGKNMVDTGHLMKNTVLYKMQELEKETTKNRYEFIIEDSAFDSSRTALANAKLINQDKVSAVISFGSRIGNVVSPVTERNSILHLSACASDENVAIGKYNFIHWTQPKVEVDRMVEEIKNRGIKSVAIIVANDAATLAMGNTLEEELTKLGIKNYKDIVDPNLNDFRMNIPKMEKNNPEIYALIVFESATMNFVKQARELNLNKPLTSIETFSFLADQSILEGYWYVDPAEITGEFKTKIETFNKSDNIFALGNIYDSLNLLITAFEKAPTPEQAVDELEKIKTFDGVLGRLTQDENGIFQSKAIIKTIKNGKAVVEN
ncbi:MAG: ABC transporter substrate-binding protein [Lactobacillus sp.]|jgi:ABC-type branched-subunit amino acid transport system substrate-binding protein|nr:ABC transporter substrate-binding protein [Lactobacillus sp.]